MPTYKSIQRTLNNLILCIAVRFSVAMYLVAEQNILANGYRQGVGAHTRAAHVGIIQSLLTTCRLHGINPYTWLVDVLQRIDRHPASQVAELPPRVWKEMFAKAPLRSALYDHHD